MPLGPQDTDQASSSVLSIHLCKATISLQQSAPGWYQTEKSKHRGSCQAQHPLSTQRLQSHVLRLDAAVGWVILQEATLTRQLSQSLYLYCISSLDFRGHRYDVLKIKFVRKMGVFRESLQLKEHTMVEGRLIR